MVVVVVVVVAAAAAVEHKEKILLLAQDVPDSFFVLKSQSALFQPLRPFVRTIYTYVVH